MSQASVSPTSASQPPRFLASIDILLRGKGVPTLPHSVLLILLAGGIYGGAMGSFAGDWQQVLFAAIKLPLFFILTFALTLPSLVVLNMLSGIKAELELLVRALVSQMAVLTLVLASLAPITLLWYASTRDYTTAVLFNGLVFLFAIIASLPSLARSCQQVGLSEYRYRALMYLWQFLFVFVAIQMAWMLRPFIGSATAHSTFIRTPIMGNAYEVLLHLIGRAM